MALLVPVAFAPDWVEWIFAQLGHQNREISHSLISVGVGATIVALTYIAVTRATMDGVVLWLTYASHWPADFITGRKPTWPGGPIVGLQLYDHPLRDVVLESALVVVCWLIYCRSLQAVSRKRAINVLIPLGLVGMQILFEAINHPTFP